MRASAPAAEARRSSTAREAEKATPNAAMGIPAHLGIPALRDRLAPALRALAAHLADGAHRRPDAVMLEEQEAGQEGVEGHEEGAGRDPPARDGGHDGHVSRGGGVGRSMAAPEAKHP